MARSRRADRAARQEAAQLRRFHAQHQSNCINDAGRMIFIDVLRFLCITRLFLASRAEIVYFMTRKLCKIQGLNS